MPRYIVFVAAFAALLTEVTPLDEDGCDVDIPYDPFHPCPRSYIPVCGSDSRTYANDCIFCNAKRAQMSRGLRRLTLFSHGKCEEVLPATTRRPITISPDSNSPLSRIQALFEYFETRKHPWMRNRSQSLTQRFPFFERLRYKRNRRRG